MRAAGWWLLLAGPAAALEISEGGIRATVDPATLAVQVRYEDGAVRGISDVAPTRARVTEEVATGATATWRLPDRKLALGCRLEAGAFVMTFHAEAPVTVTWPAVPGGKRPLLIPMWEGLYVPSDAGELIAFLVDAGPLPVTEELSVPFVGVLDGSRTLTYIIENEFNDHVTFTSRGGGGAGFLLDHEFTPLNLGEDYRIRVERGPASPVEPARAYRRWLVARGGFVPMADKIARVPRAERLLGAPQAYLWDDGLLAGKDVTDWKAFCRALAAGEHGDDTPAGDLWAHLSKDGRKNVAQALKEEYLYDYLTGEVARALSQVLADPGLAGRPGWRAVAAAVPAKAGEDPVRRHCRMLAAAFPGRLRDPEEWGAGISLGMLRALKEAGLERMVLVLGGLHLADHKPHVAAAVDALGWLLGPYDAYSSVHNPHAAPDDTWDTAQFDQALFEAGPIVTREGKKIGGFQKQGYELSSLAVRPYVERRVNGMMAGMPYSAWFVDCDAYGDLHEDYAPAHTATQRQEMQAKLDRMAWMAERHGLVIGSERGGAFAAPVIHFAHGMISPVIAWGDKDMNNPKSRYYTGSWWPPDGPEVFVKPVALKDVYRRRYYDPRYRLPLFEVVFHDSVVATHHWGAGSLKYPELVAMNALCEQLYQVPPLYHLNPAEFKKHRAHITAHDRFFRPLHRKLGLEAMTDFAWLDRDRLVQRTTFAGGTTITANFGRRDWTGGGATIPALTAVARPGDGGPETVFRAAP